MELNKNTLNVTNVGEQEWQGFELLQQEAQIISTIPNKPIEYSNKNKDDQTQSKYIDLNKTRKKITVKKNQNYKQNYRQPFDSIKDDKILYPTDHSKFFNSRTSYNGYNKIPINRYLDHKNIEGNIIYRGFNPTTSDKYINTYDSVSIKESKFLFSRMRDTMNGSIDIQFNSKFECGNADFITKVLIGQNRVNFDEYNIYLRVDSNTYGHCQWFYFKALSKLNNNTIRINIYRFKKKNSLFLQGMKPYGRKEQGQWEPVGFNVQYHLQDNININNNINNYSFTNAKLKKQNTETFYLSFQYCFQLAYESIEFAACIPYSYTYLNKKLIQYQNQLNVQSEIIYKRSILCLSLCGLNVPLLTILPRKMISHKRKNYIIINARTHPGQTSASWVLDGILKQISNNIHLQNIINHNHYIFKIIPMLNPDGVYIGNYRTGILGQDYNRNFLTGKGQLYPQITALKKLIMHCKHTGSIQLFLDLHGHSIRKNSFMYGPSHYQFMDHKFTQLLNHLHSKSKYFAIKSCILRNDLNKQETARMYFQTTQNIFAMTCQSSLGVYHDGIQNKQYCEKNWMQFGSQLALCLGSIINQENKYQISDQWIFIQKYMNKKNIEKSLPNYNLSKKQKIKLKFGKAQIINNNKFSVDTIQELKKNSSINFRNNFSLKQSQEVFEKNNYIRSHTQGEDLLEQIKKINKVSYQDIKYRQQNKNSIINIILEQTQQQQQFHSHNDSDHSSQDLNIHQKNKLQNIVQKTLNNNKIKNIKQNKTYKTQQLELQKQQQKQKYQQYQELISINKHQQQIQWIEKNKKLKQTTIPKLQFQQNSNQSKIKQQKVNFKQYHFGNCLSNFPINRNQLILSLPRNARKYHADSSNHINKSYEEMNNNVKKQYKKDSSIRLSDEFMIINKRYHLKASQMLIKGSNKRCNYLYHLRNNK